MDLGGTPLYGFFPSKKGVTDLGGTPPPFTDKIRKVVFDGAPKSTIAFIRIYQTDSQFT